MHRASVTFLSARAGRVLQTIDRVETMCRAIRVGRAPVQASGSREAFGETD